MITCEQIDQLKTWIANELVYRKMLETKLARISHVAVGNLYKESEKEQVEHIQRILNE